MKKLSTSIFSLFFLLFSLSAKDITDYGFHFSLILFPFYTYEHGFLNEYVYTTDYNDQEYKLSELNWPVRNHTLGFAADFGWKWISLDARCSFGLNGSSASMFDSDWQNNSDHSMKTEFSISENTQNNFISFEYGLKGNIPLTPESNSSVLSLSYKPSVKYAYSYYSFSARNGEGWYGSKHSPIVPYDSPDATHYEKGQLCGIDYVREHQNVFIGQGFSCKLFDCLNFEVNADISVYSLIKSVDTHFSNMESTSGTDYLDIMQGYFDFYRFSASISYNFIKDFYIGADYTFTLQTLIQGANYRKPYGNSRYTRDTSVISGSSAQVHSLTLYMKFALKDTYFIF